MTRKQEQFRIPYSEGRYTLVALPFRHGSLGDLFEQRRKHSRHQERCHTHRSQIRSPVSIIEQNLVRLHHKFVRFKSTLFNRAGTAKITQTVRAFFRRKAIRTPCEIRPRRRLRQSSNRKTHEILLILPEAWEISGEIQIHLGGRRRIQLFHDHRCDVHKWCSSSPRCRRSI